MSDGPGSAGWQRLLTTALTDGVPNPRIGALCIELAEVAGAGISMMTAAGNSGIMYASDAIAAEIEELQFLLGEGPCMDAFVHGDPVFIADLDDPEEGVVGRWPAFVQGAAALGVRAVYAVPLRIGAIRLGVMDLYRRKPGQLTATQLEAALAVADVAALSLLHLAPGAVPFRDSEGDRSAYRMQVHQATGMVKVQTGRRIEEALLLLRAHAFTESRAVADVADDVIAGRIRFPKEAP